MRSYDYANRQGVEELSWEQFNMLCNRLVELAAATKPDVVMGIARAGLFPATAVACKLRLDLYPVRVSRREGDQVVRERPEWKTPVPDAVRGKVVVVVDEMADTGETLQLVSEEVRARGAKEVVSAALVAHSWADPFPDAVALTSDALVVFPWDKMVYLQGEWRPHPELVEALALQSQPDPNSDG